MKSLLITLSFFKPSSCEFGDWDYLAQCQLDPDNTDIEWIAQDKHIEENYTVDDCANFCWSATDQLKKEQDKYYLTTGDNSKNFKAMDTFCCDYVYNAGGIGNSICSLVYHAEEERLRFETQDKEVVFASFLFNAATYIDSDKRPYSNHVKCIRDLFLMSKSTSELVRNFIKFPWVVFGGFICETEIQYDWEL